MPKTLRRLGTAWNAEIHSRFDGVSQGMEMEGVPAGKVEETAVSHSLRQRSERTGQKSLQC